MKRKPFDGDPVDALRKADPLDRLDVPQDTKGAHARALFQEVTSMDTMEKTASAEAERQPVRRRFTLAAASAAIVLVVVAAIAVFAGGDDASDDVVAIDPPAVTDAPIVGGVPIAAAAMCAEFYDLATLADRDVAFDGTVLSSSGDSVTFAVNEWYAGGDGAEVTLDAMGIAPGTITSAGPALELGERYLVSGSGGNVWSCGFTMTYDTAIAGEWATVFGG